MKSQRASVIGLGYVGLSLAAVLASKGVTTVGIEKSRSKLKLLSKGKMPFQEKGLRELVQAATIAGTLSFTEGTDGALAESDVVFISVGTPQGSDGTPDLSQVVRASEFVGKTLGREEGHRLVVLRSTVPPGTTEGLVRPTLDGSGAEGRYGLAYNPEFLSEGNALEGTLNPDRVVIGADEAESGSELLKFYKALYRTRNPKTLVTNSVNAELMKYANNAFLATKVSFINEVANLCSTVKGADVQVVARGLGMDRRIGASHLEAGIGYGGSCLPKDVAGMTRYAKAKRRRLRVVEAASAANSAQRQVVVDIARKKLRGLRGRNVALLGISFKPGTDDIRGSVSVALVEDLLRAGCKVKVYDPQASASMRGALGTRTGYATDVESCVRGADVCIVATGWSEFKKLGPRDFRHMRRKFIIDGRRTLDPSKFHKTEFEAIGLAAS